MKKDLWEELKKDATRKATPALLEREFSKVAKAAALQRTIEELCRLGSKVVYVSGDTGDASSVAQALREAGRTHKTIDLVIHAAGLEESKLLADKRVADFDRVFRAKAHGAVHLLHSVPPTGAQSWLFLSSVVGRFGNAGQSDYAAASDLLGKLASGLRSKGKTATAVDLTAFSEIGMAARGSVEAFLKSQGVEFMPPKTGVDLMLREVFSPDGHAEGVLAGSMGKLDVDAQLSSLPAGREPARPAPPAAQAAAESARTDLGPLPQRPLFQKVLSQEGGKLVVEKTFALESDPWLADHAINGVPYMPGVMGLELLAETAGKAQGQVPAILSQVRFSLPVKLLRNRPICVRVESDERGDLAIRTDFVKKGVKLGGPRTHFTARTGAGPQSWEGLTKPAFPPRNGFAADAQA
ncbi:MAG: SDR family NAD(P)-dependent oxidoreductase, partial [Elusimicrobiota bacterium]